MSLTTEAKAELVKNHQRGDTDTGSPEVQIALLTARISTLTEHLKAHKKDKHSRRGLIGLVNRRRKLLDYLKRVNSSTYQDLIKALGIRR